MTLRRLAVLPLLWLGLHAAHGNDPVGMVWIPGGEFSMGADEADARPIHRVSVHGFWMDATEVTNEQFARFVAATHYVTVAERKPRAADYPGAPPEVLVPGSIVFAPPAEAVSLEQPLTWWRYVAGVNWRQPEGAKNHPVVHVAYEDAEAFAKWAGKRLPTEAEWEFAARGGKAGARYAWGNELRPNDRWMANIFQGEFPHRNTSADGFAGTAPVASFPANGYGLYDVAGNVWEWCSDWYSPSTYANDAAKGGVTHDPRGPAREASLDPQEPGVAKRVQRGGSFLCSEQYCTRYTVGARGHGAPDTASNHVGFRCVKD